MAVARSSNAARPGEAAEGFDMGAESRRSGITKTKAPFFDLTSESLTNFPQPKAGDSPNHQRTRAAFEGPNPQEGLKKAKIVVEGAALVASLAVGASAQ